MSLRKNGLPFRYKYPFQILKSNVLELQNPRGKFAYCVGVNGDSLKAIFLQQSSHGWWAYKREVRKVTLVFSKPGKAILCSSNKVDEPQNNVGKWNELFEQLLLSDCKDTSWVLITHDGYQSLMFSYMSKLFTLQFFDFSMWLARRVIDDVPGKLLRFSTHFSCSFCMHWSKVMNAEYTMVRFSIILLLGSMVKDFCLCSCIYRCATTRWMQKRSLSCVH